MKNLLRYLGEKLTKLFRAVVHKQVDLSVARVSTYSQCPLKYQLNYIYKTRAQKDSPHLAYNNSMHKALSEFVKAFNVSIAGEEHLLELLDKHWIRDGYESEEQEKEFKEQGRGCLKNYHKVLQKQDPNTIMFERELVGIIEGNIFKGRADRIDELKDGTYVIIDYKTGRNILAAESMAADFQANMYWLIGQQTFPKKKIRLEFHYMENGSVVAFEPIESIVQETLKMVRETAEGICDGEFEPNQGPLCGWCDYYDNCPAWIVQKKRFPESSSVPLFRLAREDGRMGLSYSKMGVFQNCPLSYKYLYIDKRGMRPKHFFSIGLTCHQAFEDFYQYEGPRAVPSLGFLLERYKANWISKGYDNKEHELETFKKGEEWMKNYYDKYIVNGDGFIPAWKVEMYFELPIGKNGSIMIGFMDRIQKNADGSYEIFDYKTDPKMRTQEEVDNDLQLTIYYWAMREALGIEVKALTLLFLQFNQCITTKREPKDIQKIADAVDATSSDMLDKQRRLTEFYMKTLDRMSTPYKLSGKWTVNDAQKLRGLLNTVALSGSLHAGDAKKCIVDGDLIFPPSVNKYCGGCDYLVGCPLEHDIRTKYKDKIMHKLDDNDKDKQRKTEQESSKVDLETSREAGAENQSLNTETEGAAPSTSDQSSDA